MAADTWLRGAGLQGLVLDGAQRVVQVTGDWAGHTAPPEVGAPWPILLAAPDWDAAWRRLRIDGTPQVVDTVRYGGQVHEARLARTDGDAVAVTLVPAPAVPTVPADLQAVRMLLQGTGHDLNHIFGVLLTQVGMLDEDLRDGAVADAASDLADIAQVVMRAQRVSRQIQQLGAQLTPDPSVNTFEALQLNAVVADAGAFLRRILGPKVPVTLDLPEQVPAVWGSRIAIDRLLLNMATNIAEARAAQTPPPPTQVTVRVTSAGPWVALTCTDTAGGIAPDLFGRLGEEGVSSKDGPGRGVGLRAMADLVAQHHGELVLTTVHGRGTEYRILLPCVEASHSAVPVARHDVVQVVDETTVAGEATDGHDVMAVMAPEPFATQLALLPPRLLLLAPPAAALLDGQLPPLLASRVLASAPSEDDLAQWLHASDLPQRRFLTDSLPPRR